MEFEIKGHEILEVTSAFLFLAALLTFTTGNSMLSPVTETLVTVMLSGVLLATGLFVKSKLEKTLAYGLSAASFTIGVAKLLSTFSVDSSISFLIIGGAAVILAAVSQLVQKDRFEIDRTRMLRITAFVAVVLLGITAFDVTGSQPSYTLNLNQEINTTNTEEIILGNMIVQNSFALPRKAEIPDYEACVRSPEISREIYVNIENSYELDTVHPNTIENLQVTTRNPLNQERQTELNGIYQVRQVTSCPNSADQPTIFVTEEQR